MVSSNITFSNLPPSKTRRSLNITGHWGWSLSQLPLGERQGTHWTGHQSISGTTQRDIQGQTTVHTHIHTYTCMYLDCGRKPEIPQENYTSTNRTHKLSTVGVGDLNLGPYSCELRASTHSFCICTCEEVL
ncbi:hypothetical protein Q5P01_020486 [Channa striata]|uniref:Uncharacterized protein n=1 Tax=Channa striata TaxID=64152 RepID=A0AA88LXI5_CHASR|nr:hypothetical protein Q5P01_020486 [Channa striata]